MNFGYTPDRWFEISGPMDNVVVSSRTRYARNLKNFSFARWAKDSELEAIIRIVKKALCDTGLKADFTERVLENTDAFERSYLKESRLISAEFEKGGKSRIVLLSKDSKVSIMINEEDHLRLQSLEPGFQLETCLKRLDEIDETLGKSVDFAFSEELGFLTACPTNIGTGFRASVMLHLPAIVLSKQISQILHSIAQYNLTARGLYGEGSEFTGDFFQISNEFTLGKSEQAILDGLKSVVEQIIEKESLSRQKLFAENPSVIDDYVWRSFGVLASARRIDFLESIKLLSRIRLGIEKGCFGSITHSDLNRLMVSVQPAHIQYIEGRNMDSDYRDIVRADFLRAKFSAFFSDN